MPPHFRFYFNLSRFISSLKIGEQSVSNTVDG